MNTRIIMILLVCMMVAPAWAGFEDGLRAYENKDYTTALREWQPLAEKGNAAAQYMLGEFYRIGLGMPQDHAKAVIWLRKAADQGNADAQFSLGGMYSNGFGVRQDNTETAVWYRKAAEQGLARAQSNLGWMYTYGIGVPKDEKLAVAWTRKAAEQGDASAQATLGTMYRDGAGVPQDFANAVTWYRKAAEQGISSALNDLGTMYRDGKGVTQNYIEATTWYRKADEKRNTESPFNLGVMYEKGQGVQQNYKEAVRWFARAIENGNGNREVRENTQRLAVELAKHQLIKNTYLMESPSSESKKKTSLPLARGTVVYLLDNQAEWSEVLSLNDYKPVIAWIESAHIKEIHQTQEQKLLAAFQVAEAKRLADYREEQEKKQYEEIKRTAEHKTEQAKLRSEWKNRLPSFRAALAEGTETNCGPVLEVKESLVKVYAPVKDYGNEHWLRRETVFPPGYECTWNNGQYQPPREQ